tara:strand:+ start:84 stop:386 length:303 start_codon:yes stop_codon:yes gene_type:complete
METKEPAKEKSFAEELKELHLSFIAQNKKKEEAIKQESVNYEKMYEALKKEYDRLKSRMENNSQTVSGSNNIQISAGKDVNITISEGDKFSDSVNVEERK